MFGEIFSPFTTIRNWGTLALSTFGKLKRSIRQCMVTSHIPAHAVLTFQNNRKLRVILVASHHLLSITVAKMWREELFCGDIDVTCVRHL